MGKLSFVCFSQNNWEKRKARKQQFMLHLSKRNDVDKVLYIEPPLNFFRLLIFPFSELKAFENRRRWLRAMKGRVELLSGKLFLFTPVFFIPFSFRFQFIYNVNLFLCLLRIKAKIKELDFKNIILWLYHPYDYLLLRWFKNRVSSIFDWAEEWTEYFVELAPQRRNKITKLEERIVSEADIVFVVSERLLHKAKEINANSYQLLDGTNPELFQKETQSPKDIANIRRPIIGYAGTITERTDVKLLEFVSDNLPDISIVLIGNVHRQRVNISSLAKRQNVYFLDEKPYEQLPAYMRNFDVCILPRRTDLDIPPPTKVFDYLASGKPVVSTDIPEIERLKDTVKIGKTKEQFVEFIKGALVEDLIELKRLRIEKAQNNSWAVRAEQIMKVIKNQKYIKKVLVIPSHFVDDRKMKVRIIEIAKGLSLRYKVYLLGWHAALAGGFVSRFWSCMLDLFKRQKLYKKKSLIMVEFPILHRPLFLALKFNSYLLKRFIRQQGIDFVVSGSYYMFEMPINRDFKYIQDLADLPAPGFNNYFDRFIHRQTSIEAKKADAITVVSSGLLKYVSENYNRQAHLIPNGAYINKLRSVNQAEVDEIRRRYGLTNKWIIGYIGFVGPWVDIEFLVSVYYQVKKEITNAALLIVGASPRLNQLRQKFSGEGIVITGTVEGDISNYFNALDIAVLPHKKNLYQDLAFHIKLIEYTAARKIVVSSSLQEVKRLNFPNVLSADLNIADWVKAVKKAKNINWNYEWDRLVEPYDWNNIANQFCNIIEGLE